jgi:bacillithiol system protein YtxJ
MENGFIEISNREALDQFLTSAGNSTAVLFKHSNTCGISARAYSEMSRLDHPVGLVVVQHARALSDEIEKRWDVPHETPQVLIIREGKVVWDTSHFEVKAEAVNTALQSIGTW